MRLSIWICLLANIRPVLELDMKKMVSILLFTISLLILHITPHSVVVAAPSSGTVHFSWVMFLPAITSSLNRTCNADHLEWCTDVNTCKIAGGHWYSNQCNDVRHPNQIKTEELAGAWTFATTINDAGNPWFDRYALDINSVIEDPAYPGEFIISGTNTDIHSKVIAGYDPDDDGYFLYDEFDNDVDLMFFFTFSDSTTVSGENYVLYNESSDVKNGPYATNGQKTN